VSRQSLSNVMFTGLVPREKVPGILAASDMAVVTLKPSDVFKTVLPSKMFEAMAAARPIVLAVEGEAQTVLEQAGAGIAVQPGDAAAMAAAIARLASDRHERTRMGQAGVSFVARVHRPPWAALALSSAHASGSGQAGRPVTSPGPLAVLGIRSRHSKQAERRFWFILPALAAAALPRSRSRRWWPARGG
jgi:hypothetical protein